MIYLNEISLLLYTHLQKDQNRIFLLFAVPGGRTGVPQVKIDIRFGLPVLDSYIPTFKNTKFAFFTFCGSWGPHGGPAGQNRHQIRTPCGRIFLNIYKYNIEILARSSKNIKNLNF